MTPEFNKELVALSNLKHKEGTKFPLCTTKRLHRCSNNSKFLSDHPTSMQDTKKSTMFGSNWKKSVK